MKRYQTRVPSGYQEVEYLKSNGTQYIDTNIIPTNSAQTKVQFEFQLTDITNGIYQSIGCNSNMNFTSSQALLKFRSNAIEIADFDTAWHICEISKSSSGKVTYFDGVEYSTSTVTEEAIPFLLFGMSLSADRYYGKYKLKYFKCYENNTLVRNMIPVRRVSDNVLGMYDIANDVFYTNQGTGTFEAGADVDNWQTKSPPRYETATDAVTNLPVTIITDGQPVSSYTLKGNTSTSGTPSPSNPITINGVGNKTANLYFKSLAGCSIDATGKLTGNSQFMCYVAKVEANKTYIGEKGYVYAFFDTEPVSGSQSYNSQRVTENARDGITSPINGYVAVRFNTGTTDAMLSEGTTILPYEPYGYKISISSNSTALTPMYLTEQLMKINDYADSLASSGTVSRSIKQVAFTGQEEWEHYGSSVFWTRVENNGVLVNGNGLSNSYIFNPTTSSVPTTIENGECGLTSSNGRVYIKNTNYANATAFKQYLADQNATGTPVTMYYVINTATTESVTAPSIPTTGGEVSIDVDTTVKPSEMSLTYHGWHSHEPLKRENGSWA